MHSIDCIVLIPVSYTHLDVYKRQEHCEVSDRLKQDYFMLTYAYKVSIYTLMRQYILCRNIQQFVDDPLQHLSPKAT